MPTCLGRLSELSSLSWPPPSPLMFRTPFNEAGGKAEMESSETTTITIPTHLSRPRRVIGPFTRNQVLCIFLGIAFSAELYFGLATLSKLGSFGGIVRLVIAL